MGFLRNAKYGLMIMNIVGAKTPANFLCMVKQSAHLKTIGKAILNIDDKIDHMTALQVLQNFNITETDIAPITSRKKILQLGQQININCMTLSAAREISPLFKNNAISDTDVLIDAALQTGRIGQERIISHVNQFAYHIGQRSLYQQAYKNTGQLWTKSKIVHHNMYTNSCAFEMLSEIIHGTEKLTPFFREKVRAKSHHLQIYDDLKDIVIDKKDAERTGDASPNYFISVIMDNSTDLTTAVKNQKEIMRKISYKYPTLEKMAFNMLLNSPLKKAENLELYNLR